MIRRMFKSGEEFRNLIGVIMTGLVSGERIDAMCADLESFETARNVSMEEDVDGCTIRLVREFRFTRWSKGLPELARAQGCDVDIQTVDVELET